MGEKKNGLGRGLSTLIGDTSISDFGLVKSTVTSHSKINTNELPIEKIVPNPNQPRKHFNKDKLDSLAETISSKGIIQPIVVCPNGSTYQIIAGERRWRAAQLANIHTVPVIIKNISDKEITELALIENIQREELNSIEEATGYTQLINNFGHTHEKISGIVGKSRAYISNLIRLLDLPEEVIDMLKSGQLTVGHARALLNTHDPISLALQVVAKRLSVRQTEGLANKEKNKQRKMTVPSFKSTNNDIDTELLEKSLSAQLKLKVGISYSNTKRSGIIEISYSTLNDLDRVCKMILSQDIDSKQLNDE